MTPGTAQRASSASPVSRERFRSDWAARRLLERPATPKSETIVKDKQDKQDSGFEDKSVQTEPVQIFAIDAASTAHGGERGAVPPCVGLFGPDLPTIRRLSRKPSHFTYFAAVQRPSTALLNFVTRYDTVTSTDTPIMVSDVEEDAAANTRPGQADTRGDTCDWSDDDEDVAKVFDLIMKLKAYLFRHMFVVEFEC
jgi:hypothetical protein